MNLGIVGKLESWEKFETKSLCNVQMYNAYKQVQINRESSSFNYSNCSESN